MSARRPTDCASGDTDLTERGGFLRTSGDKLALDTSEPGPGADMAIALLAMFARS